MIETELVIVRKVKTWLSDIIIDLNFCPFAKKEFVNETINFHVVEESQIDKVLEVVAKQCDFLKNNESIETSLLILPNGFDNFDNYLDLVDFSEQLLADIKLEGIFQIASFHPDYCFEGEEQDDAANYTNRSPYPMLHLLREDSLEKVLAIYPEPEQIPENNIELARAKGASFFIEKLKSIHAIK